MAAYGFEKILDVLQSEAEKFGLGDYGWNSNISCEVCCGATVVVPKAIYDSSEVVRNNMNRFCKEAKYYNDDGSECSKEKFCEENCCEGYVVDSLECGDKSYMVIW